jgi:hypothetical protein
VNPNLQDAARRHKIILTATVAGGVVAVLAIGIGAYALTKSHTKTVGASSALAGAQRDPAPSSPGPGASAPPAPSGSATASASTAKPPPPPPGATPVEFAGVQLKVPAGWHLDVTDGFGGLRQGCVAPGNAHPDGSRQQDCTIVVRSFRGFPPPEGSADAPYFFADPDSLGGYADDPSSGCVGGVEAQFNQPVHQAVTISGRTGEYRSVSLDCATGADFAVQQWVFADEPNVALISYTPPGSGLRDTVRGIVAAATLPAGSGTRTTDFGIITGATGGAITLDREVAGSPFGKQNGDGSTTDENDNPKTYSLPLAPGVLIKSAASLCPSDAGATIDDHNLGVGACSAAKLQATLGGGPVGPVWIRYDAQGQVAAIVEAYRA